MQDYFYIRENLQTFKIEEKLLNLSKLYKDKKVAILGANYAFKAIDEVFDLKQMFNIVGLVDGNVKNIENFCEEYRIIPFDNLYFSGIDLLINLKDDGFKIEKYLRKNNLIKKKVKFINLLEKSIIERIIDSINLLHQTCLTIKKTNQIIPIVKDLLNYDSSVVLSRFNYRQKISDISKNSQDPIRVLFVVFDYKYWSLTINLYYKMRSDENFKLLPILVLPDILSESDYNSTQETLNYFKTNGYNCLDGIEHESNEAVLVKALKPDIIIYQQIEYLKADYTPKILSEYALTCYIEPSFSYYDDEKGINRNILSRLMNTWKVYTSNKESYKQLKNTVDSGFTLFEKYHNASLSNNVNSWPNLLSNKIVYRPSFNIDENFDKIKFFEEKHSMLEYANSHQQYSFIVILDKNFKKQCIENNIFNEEEYNEYINSWNALSNSIVKDDANAVSIYNSSDILITDNMSSACEYFPCGKPIILLYSKEDVEFNFIGKKIFNTLYKLPEVESLDIILQDLLIDRNDYMSKDRFSILGKYNDYFNKDASDLIIQDLKMCLGRIESDK